MIRIQKADEVEEEFFCTRNFGESIESVRDILRNVKLRKDEALREYSKKFDLASPYNLKIPEETLKNAAEKNEPSILARYLIDLSQSFSTYYNEHRIITEDK